MKKIYKYMIAAVAIAAATCGVIFYFKRISDKDDDLLDDFDDDYDDGYDDNYDNMHIDKREYVTLNIDSSVSDEQPEETEKSEIADSSEDAKEPKTKETKDDKVIEVKTVAKK